MAITQPTSANLAAYATEVADNLAERGDYDSRVASAVITLASEAQSEVTSLTARSSTGDSAAVSLTTRVSTEESSRASQATSLTTRVSTAESTEGSTTTSLTTRVKRGRKCPPRTSIACVGVAAAPWPTASAIRS